MDDSAPHPHRDLDGKVALIVGGSRNHGAACAEHVAARGAATVFSYSGDERAAEETLTALDRYGVTAEASRSDATVSAAVDTLFEGIVARHGRLDIVVHVPIAILDKRLADCTDEDFDRLIDVNTRSAFHSLRAAARHVSDGGRCVVLSTAFTAGAPGAYGLSAGSKAAVEHMVRASARELAPRGVTVNAVAPGPVPGLDRYADIAHVVGRLLGAEASAVSGRVIRADGAST
ncbi:SDR family oxidoreductase [Streptomyces sp. SID3343]|uniref:SDR family oxidoreductase n=1 Tax=Streptomyces sp. SID3343 TaxID=2690260 RepID=UPI001368FC8F|nr:SDR family oxidoreductase [Streptomyces sp. SID3343]